MTDLEPKPPHDREPGRAATPWGALKLFSGPVCLLTFILLLHFDKTVLEAPRWGPYAMIGRNTSIPLVAFEAFWLLAGLAGMVLSLVHLNRIIQGLSSAPRMVWWVVALLLPLPLARGAISAVATSHEAKLRRNGQGPFMPDVQAGDVPADIQTSLRCGDIRQCLMSSPQGTYEQPWSPNAWRQGSRFRVAMEGRRGGDLSLAILSPEPNDARWLQRVSVAPHTPYLLTGWVRTEDVSRSEEPAQLGAHLAIFGRAEHSEALFGTQGWTMLSLRFDSGADTSVLIACRLGTFGGTVRGKAWFDDLALMPVR